MPYACSASEPIPYDEKDSCQYPRHDHHRDMVDVHEPYSDCGQGNSINRTEAIHHQLVEQWFQARFFVPRPDCFDSKEFNRGGHYSSFKPTFPTRRLNPSSFEEDDTNNIVVSSTRSSLASAAQSMVLFSDSLVTQEIRSAINTGHYHQSSCASNTSSLSYRFASDDHGGFPGSSSSVRAKALDIFEDRCGRAPPPPGVVVVLDGSPLFPSIGEHKADDNDQNQEADQPIQNKVSKDETQRTADSTIIGFDEDDDEEDDDDSTSSMMRILRRTFSFDDQLPIIHNGLQTASFCMANSSTEDDIDHIDECQGRSHNHQNFYSQKQLSFTIPITASTNHEDGGNKTIQRTNFWHHVSPLP